MAQEEPDGHYRLERETLREVSALQLDVAVLKREVGDLRAMLSVLITRPEFTPVKLLTYGLSGSVLAGVVAALLAQVIHK